MIDAGVGVVHVKATGVNRDLARGVERDANRSEPPIQTTQPSPAECLLEAAKLAPRYHPALAAVYEQEKKKDNCNRATLAVARKLVAYLLAVDRRQTGFLPAVV